MKKIEILAPAGSFDSVIAAVRSGADAVYLGEKAFSARSSAKNFDDEELKKATAYCHIHGVKVYVTINTIVFDDELEKLKKAIISAAEADVDALIVQLVQDGGLHFSKLWHINGTLIIHIEYRPDVLSRYRLRRLAFFQLRHRAIHQWCRLL